MTDFGMELEALEQERWDADLLQAQYEAEGREFGLRQHQSELLRAEGNLEAAAAKCPHSGGYPLDSLAAENEGDPNQGEEGWRCWDCGSRLTVSYWDGGTVLVPCEWRRER